MTNPNYTHLLSVVDRSGSMYGVHTDMMGALNALFAEQAGNEGKCLVDYVQFDNTYEVVFTDKDVSKAKAVIEPRGATALLDALGKSVTDLGKRFAEMNEEDRPGLVQVLVVTDGYENASREWTAESIKALIAKQEEEFSWDFVFLGANMDAVAVGEQFGFKGDKSLTYDVHNTGAMAAAASAYTTRSRLGGASSNAFTGSERDAQKA